MPTNEFPTAIEESGFTGFNRHAREVPLDILRERLRGRITMFGLLANRLHHNGVEIATQATRQLFWPNRSRFTHHLRSNYGSRAAIIGRSFIDAANCGTRLLRFLLANGALDFQRRILPNPIGAMTCQ